MAEIEIYTTPTCPYCFRAKRLLDQKGVAYREIDVSDGRDVMSKRAGGRTSVPQVFVNGEHLGGCDDLYALDAAGGLDAKLAASA
jgi:glutaredoxin 3